MSAEHKAPAEELDVAIERMTEHDLLEVVEIEEQSGLSRWGWAAYYAELQGGNRELMLVAKPLGARGLDQHQIAGYIVARDTAGELHVNNIAVRPFDHVSDRFVGNLPNRTRPHVPNLEPQVALGIICGSVFGSLLSVGSPIVEG